MILRVIIHKPKAADNLSGLRWPLFSYGIRRKKFPKGARKSSGFGFQQGSFLANSAGVGDQVHIERLELFAHIGVPDEERAAAQRLTFTITFWPVRQANELNDEISQAVNYASVCSATKKFVAARRDKLIETLADELAMHLLEVFEIRTIAIELRKYILPDVEFVSVTVTRDRSEK